MTSRPIGLRLQAWRTVVKEASPTSGVVVGTGELSALTCDPEQPATLAPCQEPWTSLLVLLGGAALVAGSRAPRTCGSSAAHRRAMYGAPKER
ncbi:MAG: hypothetical protein ACR2FV_13740 [Ornithinimicrobium sp.]|uniref:hypothetical protein n=1 Tax=Ornithinimicrobium sp. TaxID=1977084 RepID=UPI003D9BB056